MRRPAGAFSFERSDLPWTSKQTAPQPASKLPIPRWEFIALCAALMALNSLAIDIMLPALQQIGASLGVENENHRQYVITAYILGFGGGQLFFGPISDRFGRRAPLVAGLVIYVAAAAAAAIAPSFATLLLCRVVQGIGAAATRVIAVSIVRDTFDGRRMAEVMSLIFMVFMAIPVIAPGIGQFIMLFATWHWIFITMAVGALIVSAWSLLRLPETLHPEYRRPLTVIIRRRRFPHRAHQPHCALLCLRQHLHLRRHVRLHRLGAADLCRHVPRRRDVPGHLRRGRGRACLLQLSELAPCRPHRHAPPVAERAAAVSGHQPGLADRFAGNEDAALAVHHLLCQRHAAVRRARRQFQRARHGAARPTGRHGVVHSGLHADLSRRHSRHADRPGLQRHGDAIGRRLLQRLGRGAADDPHRRARQDVPAAQPARFGAHHRPARASGCTFKRRREARGQAYAPRLLHPCCPKRAMAEPRRAP